MEGTMSDAANIQLGLQVGMQLLTLLAQQRTGRKDLNEAEVLAEARKIRAEIGTAQGTAAALGILALVAVREGEEGEAPAEPEVGGEASANDGPDEVGGSFTEGE
jgi:hypothetical protein